ncbi:MAG: hypothetical protein ACKVX9_06050, partial [Blastocatellia bacterium]
LQAAGLSQTAGRLKAELRTISEIPEEIRRIESRAVTRGEGVSTGLDLSDAAYQQTRLRLSPPLENPAANLREFAQKR